MGCTLMDCGVSHLVPNPSVTFSDEKEWCRVADETSINLCLPGNISNCPVLQMSTTQTVTVAAVGEVGKGELDFDAGYAD